MTLAFSGSKSHCVGCFSRGGPPLVGEPGHPCTLHTTNTFPGQADQRSHGSPAWGVVVLKPKHGRPERAVQWNGHGKDRDPDYTARGQS